MLKRCCIADRTVGERDQITHTCILCIPFGYLHHTCITIRAVNRRSTCELGLGLGLGLHCQQLVETKYPRGVMEVIIAARVLLHHTLSQNGLLPIKERQQRTSAGSENIGCSALLGDGRIH